MDTAGSVLLALSSGAVGAVLATAIGALFERWREQARLRADVMLSAVGLADEVWLRIIDLHLSKAAAYKGSKPHLQGEEYKANTRQLRSLLLGASVMARVAIVYGEGRETALLNQLRGKLLEAARILWAARQATWDETDRKIRAFLSSEVDPLRKQFERELLEGASAPMKWLGLRARPTSRTEWSAPGLEEPEQ